MGDEIHREPERQNVVQSHWQEDECLAVDGITFSDEKNILLKCVSYLQDNKIGFHVHPLAATNIDSILSYDPNLWASIDELDSRVISEEGLRISCGDGGFGSNGYVACLKGERVLWTAFLSSSNPFCQVTFEQNQIIALSTHNHQWIFPLDAPELVRVIV